MSSRVSAFVIWALVAATAVYWLLGLWSRGPVAPAHTVPIGDITAMRGELTRLLGAPEAPAPAAEAPPSDAAGRLRLVGIVAPRAGSADSGGVAVIAVGDKPPRPFRVGAKVDGELMLRSVALRTASIGSAAGDGLFTLQLPGPAAAATGRLPQMALDGSAPPPGIEQPHQAPQQAAHQQPWQPEPPPPAYPDMSSDVPPPMPEADMPLPELPEGYGPEGTPPPGESMRPID